MAESFRIQECLMVTGGDIDKLPWVIKPDSYKKVEDITFVKFSKVDTGFARFACGKGDLRNMDFLNSMMQMRSNATLKKAEGDQQLFDDGNADDSRRVKKTEEDPGCSLGLIRTPLSH